MFPASISKQQRALWHKLAQDLHLGSQSEVSHLFVAIFSIIILELPSRKRLWSLSLVLQTSLQKGYWYLNISNSQSGRGIALARQVWLHLAYSSHDLECSVQASTTMQAFSWNWRIDLQVTNTLDLWRSCLRDLGARGHWASQASRWLVQVLAKKVASRVTKRTGKTRTPPTSKPRKPRSCGIGARQALLKTSPHSRTYLYQMV